MTPIDDALVARVAEGDPAALPEIMARHGPALMRFARHFLRSGADADEVLQEAFLRAERAIRKGTRPVRLEAWLFEITVNRCRSRLRRHWPFISGPAAEHVIGRTAAPETAGSTELREEIDLALGRLSAPLREAFLLKHVEGLDYLEMTSITGASASALKMRVARACEQLRNHLSALRT